MLPDLPALRSRLRQMGDSELLRFGHAAKLRCNSANREPSVENFIIELEEARREWNRRKPELPSRDSI